MALWTTRELVILADYYAKNYQAAKFKLDKNTGKMKATKAQGTVNAFYEKAAKALLDDPDPARAPADAERTSDAVKGKEKGLLKWAKRYNHCITSSGEGAIENDYHTFVPCATIDDNLLCKQMLDDLCSAFIGTTKADPECLEMGDDSHPLNLKYKKRKYVEKEPSSNIEAYFKKKCVELEDSENLEVVEIKKKKEQQQIKLIDAETLKSKSEAYKNFKSAGMEHEEALRLSGLLS